MRLDLFRARGELFFLSGFRRRAALEFLDWPRAPNPGLPGRALVCDHLQTRQALFGLVRNLVINATAFPFGRTECLNLLAQCADPLARFDRVGQLGDGTLDGDALFLRFGQVGPYTFEELSQRFDSGPGAGCFVRKLCMGGARM